MSQKIQSLIAREILDSRGFPTVEADLVLHAGGESFLGRAAVPSGASTGAHEALELRDGDPERYQGKGVLKAVSHVSEQIAREIVGGSFSSQQELDQRLLALDGTENKSKLGANAILAVSLAFARARANAQKRSLHSLLASELVGAGNLLPAPLMNILNGGKHADNGLAIQEFMILPLGFDRFSEALRAGAEVFHSLKKILHEKGLSTAVGDEGGFAPQVPGEHPHQSAIELILRAIEKAGYQPGVDVFLALDCAASEFCSGGKYQFEGKARSSSEMAEIYERWTKNYPILSIEDGLSEEDWEGWKALTARMGALCQLVGDDLFVTNVKFLRKGIEAGAANAVLVKVNQIGSLTETFSTMKLAESSRYACVMSHRSGETEDSFIADLAVATGCGQIKTGSASRTDRMAKYNQLLRVEEELGQRARYAGKQTFSRYLR